MHKEFIDPEKCGHCVECKAAKICQHKAINRIDSNEPSDVDAHIAICPKNLLTFSGFSASIVKKPLWSTEVSCGQLM